MPDLPPPYADLEIRILERQEAGYPVEITFDGGRNSHAGSSLGILCRGVMAQTIYSSPQKMA